MGLRSSSASSLANNIKQSWWNWLVYERDDIEGLDSSIIQNRLVWKYSGHEQTFSDPLVDCRTCKERFRLDKLQDVQCGKHPDVHPGEDKECRPDRSTRIQPDVPDDRRCGFFGRRRVRTRISAAGNCSGDFHQLRECAEHVASQAPFGIAQIGKAFRNEVTPGNFIFRTREFEQMEMEYFVRPEDAPRSIRNGSTAFRSGSSRLAFRRIT